MESIEKKKLETIRNKKLILAIILRKGYHLEGIKFFTPDNFSQQMAFMSRKKGEIIQAHIHNAIKREIFLTQETLIIRRGKLKINFYDREQKYICSRILNQGDIALLCDGGHGFELIKNTEMVEIKQGPYLKKDDKIRFNGIENK
jgi:hypothetical protein